MSGQNCTLRMYAALLSGVLSFASGCGSSPLITQSAAGASGAAATTTAPSSPAAAAAPATQVAPAPPPATAPPPSSSTPPVAQSRFLRARQRAIFIGDSLAARAFGPGGDVPTSSGSFVVSGAPANPVALITTVGSHGMMPGNFVQITNEGDPSFQAPLNAAVVPILTVPSPTQFTVAATYGGAVMPNGDYSAGYAGNAWLVKAIYQYMDLSWMSWLNVYMKGYFEIVADYAQGGTVSAIGVALLPKIKAGPAAEYAFIQYCTNDLNSANPDVSGCLANVQTIVTAVLNMGMVPVVCLPLAIGQIGAMRGDPASAVKGAALQSVRSALLQLGAQDPRVLVLDTYGASADPSDPLGRFKPNYAPVDGIHPSSYGAASIASTIATYLQQFFAPADTLPTTIDPNALVQNGLMAGTGGYAGSTPYNTLSGAPPTGWDVSGSGGTAAQPLSLEISGNSTHVNFPGSTLDVSISSAFAYQQFQLGSNGPGTTSFATRMAANQWYRCGFQAFADSNMTNLELSGQVFLDFASGGKSAVYFVESQGPLWENGIPWSAGQVMTFYSQPFYVPAAPTGGGWLFVNGLFTGPVSNQQISVGRAFCNSIANPYS